MRLDCRKWLFQVFEKCKNYPTSAILTPPCHAHILCAPSNFCAAIHPWFYLIIIKLGIY
jgi:hypothetical protein